MRSFRVSVPNTVLDRIRRKVREYSWDDFVAPADASDWRYGPPPTWMRGLCEYWSSHYDWRAQEAAINALPQFIADVDGRSLHFVHERGSGAAPRPLLLVHGWPYSFNSYARLVERLAHPERFGGREEDAFSVVVPSLPGYGFSDRPLTPIGPLRIAEIFDRLMTEVLGYEHYVVHGGDWGSAIAEMLGFYHAARVDGIHLTMLSVRHHGAAPRTNDVPFDATAEERAFASREASLWRDESAYARIHATKPLKLAYAMADSPVGAAAWIVEAFHAWADLRNRRFDDVFTRDGLLTEVMLYLVNGAFNASTWIYVAEVREKAVTLPAGERIEVPVAIAAYSDPVFPAVPRAVAELSHNVVLYTEMDDGGHFPFYEAPEALLQNLFAFSASVVRR